MRIGALQKTTLLDFPGRTAACVFTQGCNFQCPYCHNPGLVPCGAGSVSADDVFDFLRRRRNVLEGVVITGGEPTLQKGLDAFCAEVKEMGCAVKLDTNGSGPKVLAALLRRGSADFVALDVKFSPLRCPQEIAHGTPAGAVKESLDLLHESGVPYEIRIPCAAPFITKKTFQEILEALPGSAPVFLQRIRTERVLNPAFFAQGGRGLSDLELEELKQAAEQRGIPCRIR